MSLLSLNCCQRAVFGSKFGITRLSAARFFASRNGLRNGATEDSSNVPLGSTTKGAGSTTKGTTDASNVNIGMSSRGAFWYDPSSIERRLSKVRGPPLIDPTTGEQIRRSPPKKSEEEIWFEAGLYKATEGITKSNHEANGINSSYPSSPPSSSLSSSSKIDEAMKDVALFAQGRGTLVRVSIAEVHRRQLSSFTKAYELVALPVYQKLDGLVSIRLLVDDDSNVRMPVSSPTSTATATTTTTTTTASKEEESDTNEDMIMKPKRRLFRSQETSLENVTVTNITEWVSIDALQKAVEDEEYLAAMKVLGEFFRGKASVKNTTQFLAFDVRY
jgi:hypothetical protein